MRASRSLSKTAIDLQDGLDELGRCMNRYIYKLAGDQFQWVDFRPRKLDPLGTQEVQNEINRIHNERIDRQRMTCMPMFTLSKDWTGKESVKMEAQTRRALLRVAYREIYRIQSECQDSMSQQSLNDVLQAIHLSISDLYQKQEVSGLTPVVEPPKAKRRYASKPVERAAKKKRNMSAKARAAIGRAARKRWAAWRRAKKDAAKG